MLTSSPHVLSVAPMMDVTHRHCRYFLRLLSPNALLYTEMVTTGALIHGDRERFLRFDPKEHPIALQLGGSNPDDLARCAQFAVEANYDEINLNVGCPSDRVQAGKIGACLFKEPSLVAECVQAMRETVSVPITVKTRIGVDDHDTRDHLYTFIERIANAGCTIFILHARKAWLKGLSPKENRTIPPLRYEIVYQLARDFPHLTFIGNGGIENLSPITEHLTQLNGVMLGRIVRDDPYFLALCEQQLFQTNVLTREQVLKAYLPYVEQQCQENVYLKHLLRPLIGLYKGESGAKHWRRLISEQAPGAKSNPHLFHQLMGEVNLWKSL
ncbi:MAG: tRNA dihydrouridine(20/20a) synthase DusA [Legionellales bacterium]|nr:tRNA dihydrouridine(20/20a) synthase DusA [Legionellales bacterium]